MIGAVDIGGTKIAAGIVNDAGKVLAKRETPTEKARSYRDGLSHIVRMLGEAAEQADTELSGIGIGSTGWVYPFTGEFGDVDFLPGWKGSNPVNDLAREFGVRVALENDGDAAALGEAAWGAGKGKSRLIYVTVGTGIGGGIILEGRLYRGADKAHPEVGHHVIDASGPQCTCGFRGCWEALATGPALAAWFNAKAQAADPQARALTAKEIFQCARQGHPLACEAVARETYYLGLGLANLINLFVPERIVLGGSIMKSMRLEDLRKVIAQGCRFVPFEKTELALASLGDDANLIGAAQVWHHRFVPQAPAQGAA
ncbi:MAG: glucokinase [Acidobacteria bacterium]|nr:MAG: glucokinase [Acidobacteria bacterium 13_2_20CM_58_27]PYT88155.1 MAG: glucokinase [Acidobacteriota bacterium]